MHFEGPLALLPGDGVATVGSNSHSSTRTAPSALFYNPFDDGAEGDGFDICGGGWDEEDGDSDGTGGGAGKRGAAVHLYVYTGCTRGVCGTEQISKLSTTAVVQ